jgi:hypothetical protein
MYSAGARRFGSVETAVFTGQFVFRNVSSAPASTFHQHQWSVSSAPAKRFISTT